MTDMNKPSAAAIVRHTPGPYFYESNRDGVDDLWEIIAQQSKSYVATINYWGEPDNDKASVTEANARLLAASPDMLDALKGIIAAFERLNLTYDDHKMFTAIRSARFAVALAEGTVVVRAC